MVLIRNTIQKVIDFVGMDMDYIEYLIEYGLTRQEATIYIELLRHGLMTGYEVSKETGISKSNVYAALKGLTQKGAAVCEEGEATRYIPVKVDVFCQNHLRHLEEIKTNLIQSQPKLIIDFDGYITIKSDRHIRDKIYEMLRNCKQRLYLMADVDVVEQFKPELLKLSNEGKKVVILTKRDLKISKSTFYQVKDTKGQIRFIVDSDYVLTGSINGSIDDTCLYSGQETLVNLVKETIKNIMLLADKEN